VIEAVSRTAIVESDMARVVPTVRLHYVILVVALVVLARRWRNAPPGLPALLAR
jgi:hypothetical protein